MRIHVWLGMLLLGCVGVATGVLAEEAGAKALRAKAELLLLEARELSCLGRHDEASERFKHAYALRAEANQLAHFAAGDKEPRPEKPPLVKGDALEGRKVLEEKKPSAKKKPSPEKKPAPDKEPPAGKKPLAGEKSPAGKKPSAEKKPPPEKESPAGMPAVEMLERHLAALQKRVEVLQGQDRMDAAERLQRGIREVVELLRGKQMAEAAALLGELGRGELGHPAATLKARSDAQPPLPHLHERAEHLLRAADHLRAAGLHRQAEELQAEVERMAKELGTPPRSEPDERLDDLARSLQRLGERVEKLEHAFKRLAEKLDHD